MLPRQTALIQFLQNEALAICWPLRIRVGESGAIKVIAFTYHSHIKSAHCKVHEYFSKLCQFSLSNSHIVYKHHYHHRTEKAANEAH